MRCDFDSPEIVSPEHLRHLHDMDLGEPCADSLLFAAGARDSCENPDLARGSCNITGRWPKTSPRAVQLPLLPAENPAQYVPMGSVGSK